MIGCLPRPRPRPRPAGALGGAAAGSWACCHSYPALRVVRGGLARESYQ
jgi:hypothetical protein